MDLQQTIYGAARAGDRLPSAGLVSRWCSVSSDTVCTSYLRLKREGLTTLNQKAGAVAMAVGLLPARRILRPSGGKCLSLRPVETSHAAKAPLYLPDNLAGKIQRAIHSCGTGLLQNEFIIVNCTKEFYEN